MAVEAHGQHRADGVKRGGRTRFVRAPVGGVPRDLQSSVVSQLLLVHGALVASSNPGSMVPVQTWHTHASVLGEPSGRTVILILSAPRSPGQSLRGGMAGMRAAVERQRLRRAEGLMTTGRDHWSGRTEPAARAHRRRTSTAHASGHESSSPRRSGARGHTRARMARNLARKGQNHFHDKPGRLHTAESWGEPNPQLANATL